MVSDLAAALGRLLDDAVGRGIVGCALGVRRGDSPVLVLARGLADRDEGIALAPRARSPPPTLTHPGGLPTYSLYRLDDFPPADAGVPRTGYIDHAH